MTEPIFKIDDEIEVQENINILPPRSSGLTIYTKSDCPRCDILKGDISSIIIPSYFINCDEYLKYDKEGFKKRMAYYMNKEYNKDFRLLFPVVFVDGHYTNRIEFY